jgi:hypothetical protein
MYNCTSTMVVSSQAFTVAAIELARRNNCQLIDKAALQKLDERGRSELPGTAQAARVVVAHRLVESIGMKVDATIAVDNDCDIDDRLPILRWGFILPGDCHESTTFQGLTSFQSMPSHSVQLNPG